MPAREVLPEVVEFIANTEAMHIDHDGVCRPYQGSADVNGVLTIGRGHVLGPGDEWMKAGINRYQAEEIFAKDVAEHSRFIQKDMGSLQMDDWLYSGLASFNFNMGPRALAFGNAGKPPSFVGHFKRQNRGLGALGMHAYNKSGQPAIYRDGLFYRRIAEGGMILLKEPVKKPDHCKEAFALLDKLLLFSRQGVEEAKKVFNAKHRRDLCIICRQRIK